MNESDTIAPYTDQDNNGGIESDSDVSYTYAADDKAMKELENDADEKIQAKKEP